ncbi:hypothetical protein DM02DRAFT_664503 [Periconia macrospinosa]|uniref:Uncharacterized protein n=1 Tax=Periconia macrospinosa TaxID=97972 RepID=A0A2V1CZ23_9PLEO|nr:hypothetical protein DM02DRAFT_664503 [Periconia macrospinosa]
MSCLCSKLKEKSYDEITADGIDLLTRTLHEAPQLFSIATDLETPNKRKRGRNPPSPSNDALLDLVSSYPDKVFEELLANHGKQWLSKPISFLKHWDTQHSDIVVNIYSSINRIEKSDGVTKLLKRVYCYALTELHETGTRVDDMVSRILGTEMFRAVPKDKITKEIYDIFKIGSKWKQIVRLCEQLCEEDPGKVSGVMWLLGKGYAWERASAKVCEQAIADIGPQSDLFIQAKKYSSSVNTILTRLKKESSFLPSGAHASPQCPLPLGARERLRLPILPSQEHIFSRPCPSQVPPSFSARLDISYGAPPADPLQPSTSSPSTSSPLISSPSTSSPSMSSPSPDGHVQNSGSCPPASSSYTLAVHASLSPEISSRSSEAGRWSGDIEIYGPDQPILGHDQAEPNHSRNDAEEIEVMDIDNAPSGGALDGFGGSNPRAIPGLAANGLMQWQLPPSRPHYLILLLHALGGSLIPESMFLRAQLPQPRWNNSGAECRLTGPEAGLDQPLVDILSDRDRLLQTIRALEPFVKSSTTNGSRTFSLQSQFQSRISQFLNDQDKEKWSIKALKWVCFVFPRDELWESCPSYASIVRNLLPLLDCALRAVKRASMPNWLREEAADALLAASRVAGVRRSVLSTVSELIDDASPQHLQAEVANQQSILLRLDANFDHSERVIHDFCCRCGDYSQKCIPTFYQRFQPDGVSRRLNALYGQLHRSHLENLVQCDEYKLAIQEVDNWQLPGSPSLIETRALPARTLTISKIFRSQGMFPDARRRLELCLDHPQAMNRSQVLCNLADVYCDLDLPGKADDLISPEVEGGRKRATKMKAFRRFLVSAMDIDIQRRLYDDASTTVRELEGIFNDLRNLDTSDQLLHVRVLVASARICHFRSQFLEAVQKWEVALHHVRNYRSFRGEGFTYAVIHISKSLAYLKIGERGEARVSFNRGKEILQGRVRDYWIPTLAAWAEDVFAKIKLMTGWV